MHLARVKRGERLEVTEHGRAVALLVPMPKQANILEEWIAEGRATCPTGDLLDLVPIKPPERWRPLSSILQEMRDEDER
ncbi:MAG TPA: hypothetical protein VN709_01900 [Terriglobales bacterium]|nr:hypothetical protein [Terriglobales bacterium]